MMDKGVILYPCYFDSELMRSEGRRVSRETGAAQPEPGDIERILKTSHIPYTREAKSHPAYWWKHQGRFVVEYAGSKRELIRLITTSLKNSGKKV
jgi:signal recognition particle subunit SRP19